MNAPPTSEVYYTILGSVSARCAGTSTPVRLSEQLRLLLARLLLRPGVRVTTDAIAGALWGEEDRASRRDGVHHAVKGARNALGDAPPWRIIVRDGDAYRIIVEDPLRIDAERLRRLSARGHDLVTELPLAARAMLDEALSVWGGPLFGEFADRPWAIGDAEELTALRDRAAVDLNETRLALCEHAALAESLRRQIVEHPDDERLRGQLIRALLATGRATEASQTFRQAIIDLGVVGSKLMLLGEQAARGALDEPPSTLPGRLAGHPGRDPGGVLLCASLNDRQPSAAEPGIGTMCLLVDARGGVPRTAGDGRLMATFDKPDAALNAAWAIASDSRLVTRIGVHAGATIDVAGRLIGPGPARCWQLVEAAHPGQALVSARARERANAAQALRNLGEHRFADLGRDEELFELPHPRGLTFEPPLSLGRHAHNLPVQPTRFVGRDDDLATLSPLVSPGALLALTGPGGSGKTRLALQLAARKISSFADGAWFISLAELDPRSDVVSVAATIANELGARALAGETLPAAVVRHLSDRAALLVLDNCEQVLEACADLIGQVRLRCPAVCLLATSRHRLGIDGEVACAVRPMSTDAGLGSMLPDAVELLLERAGPISTDVAPHAEVLDAAATICRAFDGLPLAIELAAGQVAMRGLAAVAAEVAAMDAGDGVLRKYSSADPLRIKRHRTIEAAIDWSYRLLADRERRALRRLAVFRGTFGESEARVLAGVGESDPGSAALALTDLLEHSMLVQQPLIDGGSRLRLLEPIRAFALALLQQDGDLEATRAHHARIFFEFATDNAPRLFGPDEQQCLNRLEADHDNLRAALGWHIDRGMSAEALRLVGSLWWLWFSHGHLEEGCLWVQRALEIDDVPTRARVRALRAGSHLSWWRGDFEACRAYNAALDACADAIADDWGKAWALMAFGAIELFSDPHKALVLFEDSKQRFEEIDRPWEAGYALQLVGGARWFGGDERAACNAFDEAVDIFDDLGHRSTLASVQRSAGLMAARCGRAEQGTALCVAALRLSRSIGDRAGSAQALNFLAAISRDNGEHEQAVLRYSDALHLAREVGELWATCWALDGLAGLARASDEPEIATRLLAHSGRLAGKAGYRPTPHESRLRDLDIAALRDVLGDEEYERAAAEGALMGVGEAVASALAFAARRA